MVKIGVINLGMGNQASIVHALDYFNTSYEFVDYKSDMYKTNFNGYILPGVGSFNHAVNSLSRNGLDEFLIKEAEFDKPILGICLGMQLLFNSSTEGGFSKGLGLIEGVVKKFDASKLENLHVGWNQVSLIKKNPIISNSDCEYYFDHSYYVETSDNNIVCTTEHVTSFPSVVSKGSIYGVQFHPEKSQICGLGLIKNFIEICGNVKANG